VSLSSTGLQGNRSSGDLGLAISADGQLAAFASQASNLVAGDTNLHVCGHGTCGCDVLVRDRQAGTTERVSVSSTGAQANGDSGISRDDPGVALSADGQAVAFASDASNLVQGDTNGKIDIFVHAH
jgi:WD40 repeat protein